MKLTTNNMCAIFAIFCMAVSVSDLVIQTMGVDGLIFAAIIVLLARYQYTKGKKR